MSATSYHDASRKGGSIQTYTGTIFYPLDPRLEDIFLEDVAHGLSNKCRFTGHTKRFYSTGEHAVRVCWHLASQGVSFMDQLAGLHHDDTDAYLPDVPTPLKVLPEFQWFRDLEHYLQNMCFEKFGCVVSDYSIIKNSDIVLLLTEKRDLMPKKNGDWRHNYTQESISPPYHIEPWEPWFAELAYLKMHHALVKAINGDSSTYEQEVQELRNVIL